MRRNKRDNILLRQTIDPFFLIGRTEEESEGGLHGERENKRHKQHGTIFGRDFFLDILTVTFRAFFVRSSFHAFFALSLLFAPSPVPITVCRKVL